jgi:hypothetical protein
MSRSNLSSNWALDREIQGHSENGPKTIVLYRARKELTAIVIHDNLIATLSAKEISYSSVTRYFREARLATSNPEITVSEINIEPDDCDDVILLALNEQPFASIRQLAQLIHLPRITVQKHVIRSLEFQIRHLR